jgi:hypothetical protein
MMFVLLQSTPATADNVMVLWAALMTAAVFLYVFYPARHVASGVDKPRLTFLEERKTQVYENLRDLNFEYKAGKYPDADYAIMRASLEDEAAAILSEIDRLQNPSLYKSGSKPKPKGAR